MKDTKADVVTTLPPCRCGCEVGRHPAAYCTFHGPRLCPQYRPRSGHRVWKAALVLWAVALIVWTIYLIEAFG